MDEVEAEEKALKEHIIQTLPKSEASGVAGKVARVTVVTKDVPQVKDWDAFYKYVSKTKSFDRHADRRPAVPDRHFCPTVSILIKGITAPLHKRDSHRYRQKSDYQSVMFDSHMYLFFKLFFFVMA